MQASPSLATEQISSAVEWPTWLLIVGVYGSWWAVLANYWLLGPVLSVVLLTVIIAVHMSLQHELLHGHPTRSVAFNGLLAYPPLALLFPYPIYRATHIAHLSCLSISFRRQSVVDVRKRDEYWR